MIRQINKHQRWLMIVIAILAIPFVFYFNKTDFAAKQSDHFATMYGKNVSMLEARRDARLFDLAMQLQLSTFAQDLAFGAQNRNEAYTQFTLNLLILRHESTRLGIRASQKEVVDLVQNMRIFRGPSGFDPKKYDEFTQSFLTPNGFTEAELEELARDEITLKKIKALVAAGVSTSESESKTNFDQLYGQVTVSVARLNLADIAKNVKVTEEDVIKYFDAHKAEYKTEEKRKVEFVTLALTDEQKKLAGKERIDVLQKLADKANDFTQALLEKGADFKQVATKFQLPVKETGEFTVSNPEPQFKNDAQLAATAFQLTQQEPNSEPVQTPDGFYIMHLTGAVEARPLTMEEARPKMVESMKTARAREVASNNGAQKAHELRESLRSGAPLQFSLEKVNLKAEKIPPFSLTDDFDPKADPKKAEKEAPDLPAIKRASTDLSAGDVSEFIPTNEGGVITIVEKREPADEAKVKEKRPDFEERLLSNKRQIVFYEWLQDRQRDAGLKVAPDETQPAPPPKSS